MTAEEDPVAEDVTQAGQECVLLIRARALAGFVGSGRPVTAKGVLRRPDIASACAAAGLPDPGRVVSAAHVPALHRAWTAAQGAAMVQVGLRDAHASTPTADPPEQWRAALAAVLHAESDDPNHSAATVVCHAVLEVIAATPALPDPQYGDAVDTALAQLPIDDQILVGRAFHRALRPEVDALEVLADAGALDAGARTLTPLGHWARGRLTAESAAPAQWDPGDVLRLRIDLNHFRPPVWRRVALPATTNLAELHQIIQILFEWDGDHLHVFTVDGMSYADPGYQLDGCADEDALTLAAALPRLGARLSYRYDLGDSWDHTVLLEAADPADPATRPTCLGGRGDAPVEDWPDDEPPPPSPLDLAALEQGLARLWSRM